MTGINCIACAYLDSSAENRLHLKNVVFVGIRFVSNSRYHFASNAILIDCQSVFIVDKESIFLKVF